MLTGTFNGSIDFGGGARTATGSSSIFVTKLDGSGGHVWSKAYGDANVTNATTPTGVAVDADGNVAVAGTFDGSLDFGGGPLTTSGDTDVFAARLDGMGNHLWSRSWGDAQTQTSAGLALAPGGYLVLAGTFAGQLDFGGGPLKSTGNADLFVAKLLVP